MSDVLKQLAAALGVEEGLSTGTVLLVPASIAREQACACAKTCATKGLLRDLGAIAAGAFADELGRANLRPADYADFPEPANVFRDRLLKSLLDDPEPFVKAFGEMLRARG